MPPNRYTGSPMALANMRAQPVGGCELCHHAATMNLGRFAETVRVRPSAPHGRYELRNPRRGRAAELAGAVGTGEH